MTRVLVVYHRAPFGRPLNAYTQNVASFRHYSGAECCYLNAARAGVPRRVKSFKPDLVVFHYTLLLLRQHEDQFKRMRGLIDFTKALDCPKALIAQDEQVRIDRLNGFINEFAVSHVFTPSPKATWGRLYRDVDPQRVSFHPILTGYIDERSRHRIERRAAKTAGRPVDIGYRTWYTVPFYGSHGQLKQAVGRLFQSRAPHYALSTDISFDQKDAQWGDTWLDFLLKCKYTIGVEGGCGVFDWDGSVAERTREYVKTHPDAPFEETRDACFPGLDGEFECYIMSPRHLEAVMTRTCQVLVEGEFAGVLEAGKHYLPLKRDLSNIEDVLETMRLDERREAIVERAYEDVVASGRYSYSTFVGQVLEATLGADRSTAPTSRGRKLLTHLRNDLEDWWWRRTLAFASVPVRGLGALRRGRNTLGHLVKRRLGARGTQRYVAARSMSARAMKACRHQAAGVLERMLAFSRAWR